MRFLADVWHPNGLSLLRVSHGILLLTYY
jgi:hypothetical protein